MREVAAVVRNGKYGVIDNNVEAVPFVYENKKDAISEWEYFERLNLSLEPHKRFISSTSLDDIASIVQRNNE